MPESRLERMIKLLARLPGLGPRSARKVGLYLIKRKESLLLPLSDALRDAAAHIISCSKCGNLDERDPCHICLSPKRDSSVLCVVEDVDDLWAIERSNVFQGLYHVLGGTLSAVDGRGPEALKIPMLVSRLAENGINEVILALGASVEGQTTAHYLADVLAASEVRVTRLGQGVPIGGELDYLDDGTLLAAFKARRDA